MKKVNWTKIIAQNLPKGSLWDKYERNKQPPKDLSAKISAQFSSKSTGKAKKIFVAKPINLKVIDTKSAQSSLILLRVQYKNTSHLIKQYISNCDDTMLNVDFIDGLIKCLPQPYQIKELRKLKAASVELADAEEFLAKLCDIERLVGRLPCIKFKILFDDMMNIKPDIRAGTAACKEVTSSQKFGNILNLILSVGNIMNAGSNNDQAVGFQLPILTKLNDVKWDDKTLLQFLVDNITRDSPELLNFGKDFKNVSGASQLDVNNIKM